ncbi:MAG: hypothetical protein M1351_00280 [Candidatus Thermoplasmatota archaeon]|nr:hypothetical protein [Candidatus Thermoplasmatota archaeon]
MVHRMAAVNIDVFFPSDYFRLFVLILVLGAILGVMYDALVRKKIRAYEQERAWKRSFGRVSGGKHVSHSSVIMRVLLRNIAFSGEIASCNEKGVDIPRRIAHLLLFWGFIVSALSMLSKAFVYPTLNASPISNPLEIATNTGNTMLLLGGILMLFMRVNVRSEKDSIFRSIRADMFLFSIMLAVVFQFILEFADLSGSLVATEIALIFYLPVTAFPFLSMGWSKFLHIIYKPVYAIHREIDSADGYSHLPSPSKVSFIKED